MPRLSPTGPATSDGGLAPRASEGSVASISDGRGKLTFAGDTGSLRELIAGKVVCVGWAFVVPALFHPGWVILLYYAGTATMVGFVLSVVFQVAHCVEEADFPEPTPGTNRLADAWAVHQVQTTVDCGQGNRLLTWYIGGLNFQIEHHLCPRICHVHYPHIGKIVQAVCAESGVRYTTHESFLDAVSSHWRWLRRMGRPPLAEATAPANGVD